MSFFLILAVMLISACVFWCVPRRCVVGAIGFGLLLLLVSAALIGSVFALKISPYIPFALAACAFLAGISIVTSCCIRLARGK